MSLTFLQYSTISYDCKTNKQNSYKHPLPHTYTESVIQPKGSNCTLYIVYTCIFCLLNGRNYKTKKERKKEKKKTEREKQRQRQKDAEIPLEEIVLRKYLKVFLFVYWIVEITKKKWKQKERDRDRETEKDAEIPLEEIVLRIYFKSVSYCLLNGRNYQKKINK